MMCQVAFCFVRKKRHRGVCCWEFYCRQKNAHPRMKGYPKCVTPRRRGGPTASTCGRGVCIGWHRGHNHRTAAGRGCPGQGCSHTHTAPHPTCQTAAGEHLPEHIGTTADKGAHSVSTSTAEGHDDSRSHGIDSSGSPAEGSDGLHLGPAHPHKSSSDSGD